VQVSLDSADPEIVDRMVGLQGYHARVFRVLENLRLAGLRVRVNAVLTPLNISTVGDLIVFLGELGNVARLSLATYGRSMFCHSDELFINSAELARVNDAVQLHAPRYPHMKVGVSGGVPDQAPLSFEEKAKLFSERGLCTANRHGFLILPDGRVTVCEQLYDHPSFLIGDLRRQSVMEIWNSPEALALLHPDQSAVPDGPCKECSVFAQCNFSPGRCWRDVLKTYGQDKPHYPDPRCPWAPPGIRLS
jgi:radical SAM protein with 4Fe4S-binding SPASM domain